MGIIRIVLGIILAWFIITFVAPMALIVLGLYLGNRPSTDKEKQEVSRSMPTPAEVKQNYCLGLLYSKRVDSYTNKTYLSRVKKINVGAHEIEYSKANSDSKQEWYLRVRIEDILPLDPIVSIGIEARTGTALVKVINFKIHGSEEEISLDVLNTPKGEYYIDFSKGSKNYEELLKVTPEGSTPKLRASSIQVLGKKSKILLTAEITDPPAHEYNGAPLLLKIRNAVDCITNPPEIPKDFTVVE